MTDQAARRIWLICSGILFILTFNYVSISQSWGASLGLGFLSIDIGVSSAVAATVIGIPVVSVGLILTSYVGSQHAKLVATQNSTWDERTPIRISGVNTRSQESKILGFLSLLVFTILPLYALWHFVRKFHKYAKSCDTETMNIGSVWVATDGVHFWDSRYKVGKGNEACGGVTFEPMLQPVLQLSLACLSTLAVIYFLYKVVRTVRGS